MLREIQGSVYEALMIAGITELSISTYFKGAKKYDFTSSVRANYLREMRPKCKELIVLYKRHPPKAWPKLVGLPEYKELTKLKKQVKYLWRKRAIW